ncbi:SRPBCC domain-containing protein [Saccharospirillum sp.]|uniref:SRPBCC domain-containing protein n=1 Tax=Saccharospirillum sp. TaxID=2033801 RepID=UPI0034A08A04
MTDADLSLITRRHIKASPSRVFTAWTTPEALKSWWGPKGIGCPDAQIDLTVGGQYRIANEMPDGRWLWIEGTFEEIVPDEKLVYSWVSSDQQPAPERVIVHFKPMNEGTEVIVIHERIGSEAAVAEHKAGWEGCLDGLEGWVR